MIATNSITNEERAAFLRKLDASDLMVTDWEADFIGSFLQASHWWNWFTPGRVKSTDRMWMKYGPDLEMPYPLKGFELQQAKVKIAEADENGCNFIIYDGPRGHECNEPATKVRRNGFRYCAGHAEEVERSVKRRGGKLILEPFAGKLPVAITNAQR